MSDEDFEPVNNENSNDITKNDANVSGNTQNDSSEQLKPGDRVAPGKKVDEDGNIVKSDAREILDAGQNAVELATAGPSLGTVPAASSAAQGAEMAGQAANAANQASQGINNAQQGANAAQAARDSQNAVNQGAQSLQNPNQAQLNQQGMTPQGQNAAYRNMSQNQKQAIQKQQQEQEKHNKNVIDKTKNKLADKIDKAAEKSPKAKEKLEDLGDKARIFNGVYDSAKSALKGDVKGAKQNIKKTKDALKKNKKRKKEKRRKRLMKLVMSFVMTFLIMVMITQLCISFLEEAWQNIDTRSRDVANNVEKLTNMYKGFGYQDSKSAFYQDLQNVDNFYDNNLDIALLLSTLFYTESMGFNTDYKNYEEAINGDPVNDLINGDTEGAIKFYAKWSKSILDDAQNTYDENGLIYNAGKIYRMRRLAAAMCERDGTPVKKKFSEFADQYEFIFTESIKELFQSWQQSVSSGVSSTISSTLSPIPISQISDALENSQSSSDSFSSFSSQVQDLASSFNTILKVISFGFATVQTIEVDSNGELMVTYIPYTVNEQKYEEYLKQYYFESTPEIKSLLPNETAKREAKKNTIYNDIVRNKKTFEEIFLNNVEADAEEYTDSCVGAIDSDLVKDLALPINSSGTITFDEKTSFGIIDGKVHNGVDLNSTTAGVKKGDDVFSIANGKIESIETDSSTSTKKVDSVSNFLFIGDSRYNGIKDLLKNYGTTFGVDSSRSSEWKTVTKNGTGTVKSTSITLPTDVSGVSVMLGVNDLDVSALEEVLNNLHDRYPLVTIYVNSLYYVGVNYKVSGVTYEQKNAQIDDFNNQISAFCNSNSWAQFIVVTSDLYENGYLKTNYTSDSIHITDNSGKQILVNNIIEKISGGSLEETGGSWIKIKHENITVNQKEYTFYSVYKNLDTSSITLKVGDSVTKGQTIAKVGTTDSGVEQLHFEFRNESDSSIDPTNLFIECISDGGVLVGNTDEEKIWNYFLTLGYPKAGIAGIMGNMQGESGLNSKSVQGDYLQSDKEAYDTEYTNNVDQKKISEHDFVYNGPGGGGYGLAQWTWYSRKQGLYDRTVKNNISIGDLNEQLNYYDYELKNLSDFASVYSVVSTTNNVKTACDKVFYDYENPADQSQSAVNLRNTYCSTIYDKYKDYVTPSVTVNDSRTSGTSNVSGQTNASSMSVDEKLNLVYPNGVPKTTNEIESYLTSVTCDTLSG